MDQLMNDPSSHDDLLGSSWADDEGIGVSFPPGLGIIPPRELTRVPRPRRDGELVA